MMIVVDSTTDQKAAFLLCFSPCHKVVSCSSSDASFAFLMSSIFSTWSAATFSAMTSSSAILATPYSADLYFGTMILQRGNNLILIYLVPTHYIIPKSWAQEKRNSLSGWQSSFVGRLSFLATVPLAPTLSSSKIYLSGCGECTWYMQ